MPHATSPERSDGLSEHKTRLYRAAEHARVPGRRYTVNEAPRYGRDICYVRVGAWRILYELVDEDEDGLMDTLRVVHFRPAAQNTPTGDEAE